MIKRKVEEFTKGWFIGNFQPAMANSTDFEVALKYYKRGDQESAHHHKISTEFTVAASGRYRMNDILLGPGDIVEVKPGESVAFECLEDGATLVVKMPSSIGDKYLD